MALMNIKRSRELFYGWLAGKLPRQLVWWCAEQVHSAANEDFTTLLAVDALRKWEQGASSDWGPGGPGSVWSQEVNR